MTCCIKWLGLSKIHVWTYSEKPVARIKLARRWKISSFQVFSITSKPFLSRVHRGLWQLQVPLYTFTNLINLCGYSHIYLRHVFWEIEPSWNPPENTCVSYFNRWLKSQKRFAQSIVSVILYFCDSIVQCRRVHHQLMDKLGTKEYLV